MPPSLLPVLPYILRYHRPVLPHSFYVLHAPDHLAIRESYETLLACTLVCRRWCWAAQVALFDCAILARPTRDELTRGTVIFGGMANGDIFLSIIRKRPDLGKVVHSLCLLGTSFRANIVQETLALCPTVSVLVFYSLTADQLAQSLTHLDPHPSVRLFGHKGRGNEDELLDAVARCFPRLVELQIDRVDRTDSAVLPRGVLGDLHYVHLRHASAYPLVQLAKLDIHVLRIYDLVSFQEAIRPFRRSLRVLDIWALHQTFDSAGGAMVDSMACLADFPELRVLKVYRDENLLFPHRLPPKLDTLTVHFDSIWEHRQHVRSTLEQHPIELSLNVHYDSRYNSLRLDQVTQILEGLPITYSLIPDHNIWD